MSPPTWLPPLNSHNAYTTSVSFRPFNSGKSFQPLTNRFRRLTDRFLINVHAVVEFTSSLNKKPFPGLYLKDTVYIPYSIITSFSSSETEEILNGIFSDMLLPFELDHLIFRHMDSGTSQPLNNLQDLAAIIHDIMYNASSASNSNMLSFRLDILKSVVIPDDEYKAWTSWYNEKRKVDPNFVMDYMSTIFSPRTEEELLQENQALASKTRARTSTDALKDVRIDSCGSSKDCLICLEELPPESRATRLPCNHVFHQGCIVKWLQESNTCPSCRFLLSSS